MSYYLAQSLNQERRTNAAADRLAVYLSICLCVWAVQ